LEFRKLDTFKTHLQTKDKAFAHATRESCSVDIWFVKVVQISSKLQIEANKPHVFVCIPYNKHIYNSIMKRKLLLFGFLLPLLAHAETNLVVVPLTGPDANYAINLIGKIRFVENSVCLYDKQETKLGCTPINGINKIVFSEKPNTPTDLDVVSNPAIHVYPNPVQSQLIINGLQEEQIVRIYSLQGQLLISGTAVSNSATLDVSDLQLGDYLLQVGADIVKFIKQ